MPYCLRKDVYFPMGVYVKKNPVNQLFCVQRLVVENTKIGNGLIKKKPLLFTEPTLILKIFAFLTHFFILP